MFRNPLEEGLEGVRERMIHIAVIAFALGFIVSITMVKAALALSGL